MQGCIRRLASHFLRFAFSEKNIGRKIWWEKLFVVPLHPQSEIIGRLAQLV
jgi:hypothetical protein